MISFKGLLIFAMAAVLSFGTVFGQIEKTDDEATEFRKVPLTDARIKFDDTEFDFGSIVKGSSVPHSFWFTNEGTDTLIITKVKPTCGCTIASGEGLVVPPGGKASIDVVFNSSRFNGKITKSDYSVNVKFECLIPLKNAEQLEAKFNELSKGEARIVIDENLIFI